MSFEPRGKVAALLAAMRAQPEKIVWPANDVAQVMEVARGNLPAYLQAVITRGMLHRKVESGKSFFSLQPFPSNSGGGLDVKVIASPEYSEAEREAARGDVRAPKTDPGWVPPKMIATRGQSEVARAPLPAPLPAATVPAPSATLVLERQGGEISARIQHANDVLNAKLRARATDAAQSSSGKRTTSAATASGHEVPDANAPEAGQHVAVANEGDARAATGGSAEEAKEELEVIEFNARQWLDGDLDLFGLIETEDGAHRITAENVLKLRRLLAWMPC